jgi:hypothetical protein
MPVRDERSTLRAAQRQLERRLRVADWLFAWDTVDEPNLTELIAFAVDDTRDVSDNPLDPQATSDFRSVEWAPARPVLHMVMAMRNAPRDIRALLLNGTWVASAVRNAQHTADDWEALQERWPALQPVDWRVLLRLE